VEQSALAAMLTQAPAGRAVYLRADGDARHRDVVRVMGEIKAAGHDRLGIVAEPEDHATQP
jgi:biopolymer transport protein ExbD